jgi:hypothetical protein
MLNEEIIKTVVQSWKAEEEHTVEEHVLYNVLRGKPLDQGFSPITHEGKIVSCGNDPHWGLNEAIRAIKWKFKSGWSYDQRFIDNSEKLFGIKFTEELKTYLIKLEEV